MSPGSVRRVSVVSRGRLARFQQHLTATEAALISNPTDIMYFTGFPQLAPAEREAWLVIFPKTALLFHHSFSPTPPASRFLNSIPRTDCATIATHLQEAGTKRLFIDPNTLTVAEQRQLKKHSRCQQAALDQRWVWQLRTIKNAQEIETMKRAGRLAARVMRAAVKHLRVGITEQVLAHELSALLWQQPGEGPAFPVIVAFGAHGALPHHQPTPAKLKSNTPVLIDLGARVEGYCSDMTRSFWFGPQPSAEFRRVERVVRAAYRQTLERLRHRPTSLTTQHLDEAARTTIANHGYGERFIHTTGHGLGLEIHEPPSLSWQDQAPIQPGMALTIEPGVYLPDQFGYRHENTVLVTASGGDILTA